MTTLEQSKPADEARDSVLRSGSVSSCNDLLARPALANCEWYKGPAAKQCQRPATHEVLAAHWKSPVQVCEHHADIARGVGFQVRTICQANKT